MSIRKIFDKNIISTLILGCFIIVSFSCASYQVNRLEEDACFNILDDTTAHIVSDICTYTDNGWEQLEIIADLLVMNDEFTPEIVSKGISSIHEHGTFSAVGLLLSDGQLIMGADDSDVIKGLFDYSTELGKVPYTSGVINMPGNNEEKVVYQAIPVEKYGQKVAVLYGFIDLAVFSDSLTADAFGGNVQIYVADSKTGDFLVDTWHDTLGNVFDGDIANRKVKKGYDFYKMKEDFAEERSGCIAFLSKTTGEYFYSYYMPVGINGWMVQLTVPESVAFENAIKIRKMLYLVAAAEIFIFAVYILWILFCARRNEAQNKQRLAQSVYMYDVQQTLFDSYKDPSLLTSALRKVSKMLTAEISFFFAMKGDEVNDAFFSFYSKENYKDILNKNIIKQPFLPVFQRLKSGDSMLVYSEDIPMVADGQKQLEFDGYQVNNMMIVPVLNSGKELVCILGCVNMKHRWKDCVLMECVSRNFLMALNNMKFYRQIEMMGILDSLTGLRNRNCYESSLELYAEKNSDSLCCLYIDANGLHELNNTMGHAAGDAMLTCIGSLLKALFSPEDCYRIGGDEFVVFYENGSKEDVHRLIGLLNEKVNASGYYISIGEAWLSENSGIEDMVSTAESKMYEAKHSFYQQTGNNFGDRIMNRKLEQILLDKKDSDAFLGIIASRFMGTYVVNMETDIARIIYKPVYFYNILEKNNYHFIPSMQDYVCNYVSNECQKDFMDFLDYSAVKRRFELQKVIKFYYSKKDGTKIVLRIYPVRDYDPDNSESIWLFEKDSD